MKDIKMKQAVHQDHEEIKIDLHKCVSLLIKRRNIVIVALILSISIGLFSTLVKPKIFEASAIIELGSGSMVPLLKPNIIEELNGKKNINAALKKLNLDDIGKNYLVIEDINGRDFVKVIIKGPDPNLAANLCNVFVDEFVAQKNKLLAANNLFLNEQIVELENRYKAMSEEIDNFNGGRIDSIEKVSYLLFQNNLCFTLKKRTFLLKEQVLRSRDFEVFERAIVPKNAININLRKTIIVSGVYGLLIGIVLVFVVEYWKDSNKS